MIHELTAGHLDPESAPLLRCRGEVDAVLRALPWSWLDFALFLIRSTAACACLRTSALGSSCIRSKAGIASFCARTG